MLWTLKKIWYRIYQNVFKVAMCLMDWSEPTLLEGAGSVLKLPEFIKGKGVNKVLVVTDKGLMGLHILDPLFEKLDEVGVEYVVYDGVQPNPTIPNIEECKDMYIQNGCEGIIAFGTGNRKRTEGRLLHGARGVPRGRVRPNVYQKRPL